MSDTPDPAPVDVTALVPFPPEDITAVKVAPGEHLVLVITVPRASFSSEMVETMNKCSDAFRARGLDVELLLVDSAVTFDAYRGPRFDLPACIAYALKHGFGKAPAADEAPTSP